jgi:response regulator RpfG family c-di-GMP phosphodiesterase
VDDEPAILRSLKRALRREAYELLCASSGEEALEILERQPVDLVVADHRMPSMSGAELLGIVTRRWPHVIRFMLSGFAETEALEASGDVPYHRFIAKPWNNADLRKMLRDSLDPG